MIYTVTLNPAIDYVVQTDEVTLGEVNRTTSEQMYFGGKGINVSLVLKELGIQSTALGFTAGFTGKAIAEGIAAMGVATDFIHLKKGNSRINVKIKSQAETELNGQGPDIGDDDLQQLFAKMDRLRDGDMLVLAGSVPGSLPSDIYEQILARIAGRKIKVVVDAEKHLLQNVLKYNPFLVKPNHHELGDLFGVTLTDKETVAVYAKKLQQMGAQNVLVSMAGDGAVLMDAQGSHYYCDACKGTVQNSVGAGDSMVAGFLAGLQQGDYAYALKLGTVAGGATAFSDGLASRVKIEQLMGGL